jgi:acyl-homoserine lactone acylase PvdQ
LSGLAPTAFASRTRDSKRAAGVRGLAGVPDAGGQLPYEPSAEGVATRRVWRPAPSTLRLARDWTERLERVPVLGRIVDDRADGGSNTWGLSGALTRSGDPMIANDPHLFLDMPSALHPIHLRAGDIDVYGESIPGTPAVIVGHSRWISWGATQNPMDVTDTFQERVVADPTSPRSLLRTSRLSAGPAPELLIGCEEDRTLRAVLVGMLREADR